MFRGIDVSNINGPVHWATVAGSGVGFAHVKASEGETFSDPLFLTNVAQARTAGLHVGPYHFARPEHHPGVAGAKAEADFFASRIKTALPSWDMRPVLDLEVGSGDLTAWAGAFLAEVERQTGVRPLLYTYPAFLRAHLNLGALKAYGLWIADYGRNDGTDHGTSVPNVEHQYTSVARITGVIGHVDENVAASLDPLLVKAPAPVKPGETAPSGEPKNQSPFTRKLWPVPIPQWFWAWAEWRQGGQQTLRPVDAPTFIPAWAWVRLRSL